MTALLFGPTSRPFGRAEAMHRCHQLEHQADVLARDGVRKWRQTIRFFVMEADRLRTRLDGDIFTRVVRCEVES